MEGYGRRASLAVLVALAGLFIGSVHDTRTVRARGTQARPCVFDEMSLQTAPQRCRPRARAYPKNVATAVQRAIYDGALTFGIPYTTLLAVARCESRLNPHAQDQGHYGLYQFVPATFRAGLAGLRRHTGIEARSYWNPLDASYVTGYLFAIGKARNWACE